jgi:hypothetical protein
VNGSSQIRIVASIVLVTTDTSGTSPRRDRSDTLRPDYQPTTRTVNNVDPEFSDAVSSALTQFRQIPEVDTWPVSERIAAFFFMVLDGVESLARTAAAEEVSDSATSRGTIGDPDHGAADALFNRTATGFRSAFQESLREALIEIIRAPDVPVVNRLVTDSAPVRFVVAELLVQLISTSLKDDSEDNERSAAFADKVIAFAASVISNPVPQKAVDVVRYAVEVGYLPLNRIPVIADWFKSDTEPEA